MSDIFSRRPELTGDPLLGHEALLLTTVDEHEQDREREAEQQRAEERPEHGRQQLADRTAVRHGGHTANFDGRGTRFTATSRDGLSSTSHAH